MTTNPTENNEQTDTAIQSNRDRIARCIALLKEARTLSIAVIEDLAKPISGKRRADVPREAVAAVTDVQTYSGLAEVGIILGAEASRAQSAFQELSGVGADLLPRDAAESFLLALLPVVDEAHKSARVDCSCDFCKKSKN